MTLLGMRFTGSTAVVTSNMWLLHVIVAIFISKVGAIPLVYDPNFIAPVNLFNPEQIHIAYGAAADQMTVTWSTQGYVGSSVVEVVGCPAGSEREECEEYFEMALLLSLHSAVNGSVEAFIDGGGHNRTQYIHRVYLNNLKPETGYAYRCGVDPNWSKTYQFRTRPARLDWSPRFAVFGDFGVVNAQSLPRLYRDVQLNLYDAVIHNGDFAYDMKDEESRRGDFFMNMIQPIAAEIPYMVSVGNHEEAYNFSNYVKRFTMPNSYDGSNLVWSMDIGPVHLVILSSEFYFFIEYGIQQIRNQYDWLLRDLTWANEPSNRTAHPWIIVLGHRPMYCSTSLDAGDDCGVGAALFRDGIPEIAPVSLETLFFKTGVDLCIWAHEHNYERMWPVYRSYVLNGSYEEPYVDPRAPVHIVSGAAGNQERNDVFDAPYYPYTAFRSSEYGYSRMTVFNATHLYWEQVSDDRGGAIVDKMTIVKHKHGAYDPIDN